VSSFCNVDHYNQLMSYVKNVKKNQDKFPVQLKGVIEKLNHLKTIVKGNLVINEPMEGLKAALKIFTDNVLDLTNSVIYSILWIQTRINYVYEEQSKLNEIKMCPDFEINLIDMQLL